jgi:hypothetical protein
LAKRGVSPLYGTNTNSYRSSGPEGSGMELADPFSSSFYSAPTSTTPGTEPQQTATA